MNQRVMIITPGTFAIPSNRNSSVEQVVEQVGQCLKGKVEIYIYGKKSKSTTEQANLFGNTYIRPRSSGLNAYFEGASYWIRRLDPHIIQVENRPKLAGRLKKLFPHRQIWLSLHSITFISPSSISRTELSRCLRLTDQIIVNSGFLKEQIMHWFPQLSFKIEVNYLGTDTIAFPSKWTEEQQQVNQQFVQKLGLMGKNIIVYAGRLISIKGVHHLLKVMPEVVNKYPETVLVVVGSAYYGSHRLSPYVRRLHQMGRALPRNVLFIPYVDHDEMYPWFRLADVAVVPSDANEAFGLVNVEAMASGTPIIATRAGGMKEVIEHGVTGLLIDSKRMEIELVEGLFTFLGDADLRQSMGQAGINRVHTQFTWQLTADRWLSLYNK